MRKLVVTENTTRDGVIDMTGGWFDPLDPEVDQSDITAATAEHQAAADALLVGRTTFEAFRGFWPQQTDDPTGVSDYLDAVDKYACQPAVSRAASSRGAVIMASCPVASWSKRQPGRHGRPRRTRRSCRRRACPCSG